MKQRFLAAACGAALAAPAAAPAATATVDVENVVAGTTPAWVGFSQGHYYPGGNTSAWLKRSHTNVHRIWASPGYYEPTDDAAPWGDGVTDLASFEARMVALRSNPEGGGYINWSYFDNKFENTTQTGTNKCRLNYMCSELRGLGVEPLVVLSRSGWLDENDWAEKWEHWQYYYALSFHLAKNYGVYMFEPYNEPDHTDITKIDSQIRYIRWTRFASDAITAAVQDVNSLYGKNLSPLIMAPALTHATQSSGPYHMDADPDADPRDDATGWGQKALQFIRTDYTGANVNYDIFNVFSTHKYGAEPGEYYDEMQVIKNRMGLYHPTGKVLPVFYTEFNRYGSAAWTNPPQSSTSLSTPDIYTDIALSMCKAQLEGVFGMTTFKFSNTYSDTYGAQKTGYHFVFDEAPYDIGGAKKGTEAIRMFAKGFKGARDRYKTTTSSSSGGYNAYTSFDPVRNCYYVIAVNSHDTASYTTTFDMYGMGIYTDSVVSIEEVGGDHQSEVVQLVDMPSSKTFTATQPSESVWLITVPKGAVLTESKITPVADAQVQGGSYANTNFGSDTAMRVKRNSTETNNRASYLKFDLSGVPAGKTVKRAILRVYGKNAADSADFQFHVYGTTDDSWQENTITWNNAPDLHPNASKVVNVGSSAWPVGDMTCDATSKIVRTEVTDFVNEQLADDKATFILVREYRYDGDTGDNDRHAYLNTREATSNRPYLELWY